MVRATTLRPGILRKAKLATPNSSKAQSTISTPDGSKGAAMKIAVARKPKPKTCLNISIHAPARGKVPAPSVANAIKGKPLPIPSANKALAPRATLAVCAI
ncbi:hypothetical protein D9M69_687370 [compost metagenome]